MRGLDTPLSDSEVAFCMRHGLAPQLHALVPSLRPLLEERFQQNVTRSLLLTAELGRLLESLPPAIAFKGPALAQRLYGDIAGREYCDLDLLVHPDDIAQTICVLQKLGYAGPKLEPWQLRAHLRNGCEYAMSDGRAHVELHWQFAPRQFGARFDIERLFGRATRVRVGDREVTALSPEDDLLMLVVHGTKHAWAKLAWVADLAALLRLCELDWDYIQRESRRMRISRMVRVALALAHWMGAETPPAVGAELTKDPEAETVAEQIRDHILDTDEPGKEDRAAHRLITAALDSPGDRLAYAARYAVTPTMDDWNYLRLPPGLRWLYPAVRILRLATKEVRD